MKQRIFSCGLLILMLLSCSKKDPIARWNKGRYDMTHIITLADGQIDTIHCVVYGPEEEKNQYTFNPEAENEDMGELIIYKGTKKKKGYFRVKYYLSVPMLYPTYYGGNIESYNYSKKNIVIRYQKEPSDVYNIAGGVITLNWLD